MMMMMRMRMMMMMMMMKAGDDDDADGGDDADDADDGDDDGDDDDDNDDDDDDDGDDDDDDDDNHDQPKTRTHFVRACAVEMHVHMSQETSEEPLYTEIYRKNAGAQREHPDQAPAFTATVRTPQCGHTVWEKSYLSPFLREC